MFELAKAYATDTARQIAQGNVNSTALTVIGKGAEVVGSATGTSLVVYEKSVGWAAVPVRIATTATGVAAVGGLAGAAAAFDLLAGLPLLGALLGGGILGGAIGYAAGKPLVRAIADRFVGGRLKLAKSTADTVATICLPAPKAPQGPEKASSAP